MNKPKTHSKKLTNSTQIPNPIFVTHANIKSLEHDAIHHLTQTIKKTNKTTAIIHFEKMIENHKKIIKLKLRQGLLKEGSIETANLVKGIKEYLKLLEKYGEQERLKQFSEIAKQLREKMKNPLTKSETQIIEKDLNTLKIKDTLKTRQILKWLILIERIELNTCSFK
jgi:hypothetical protein